MGMDFNYFKNLFNSFLEKHDAGEVGEILEVTGDEVDTTTNNEENSFNLRLKGRERFFIHKVRAALLKIEKGEFGICDECGDEIGLKRLLARPIACLCLKCKESEEKNENAIPYVKRSHTLGRTFANG